MIAPDERLVPTRMPVTPARLRALSHTLRTGAPALRALPLDARVAALDRVAASWLVTDSIWRQRALTELPMSTGYPRAAIAIALDNLWHALRAPHLIAALRAEATENGTAALPELALHVLAAASRASASSASSPRSWRASRAS